MKKIGTICTSFMLILLMQLGTNNPLFSQNGFLYDGGTSTVLGQWPSGEIGLGVPLTQRLPTALFQIKSADFSTRPVFHIDGSLLAQGTSIPVGRIGCFQTIPGTSQYLGLFQTHEEDQHVVNLFQDHLIIGTDTGSLENLLTINGLATVRTGLHIGSDTLPHQREPYIRSIGILDFKVASDYTPDQLGDERVLTLTSYNNNGQAEVHGKLKTATFQMTKNPGLNKVLISDAVGNGAWVDASNFATSYWLVSKDNVLYPDTAYTSVGIGTSNTFGYKLAVSGKILCEELKVKLVDEWPDYVFSPEHKLRSLEDLDLFIRQNNRLPDVPSAREVEQNGISVGEMNAILLKKVEELTVYIISMQKELEQLKAKVASR